MTTKALHLGPGVDLPLDAATESVGILGQRGSGKSNVAVVFAEELHKAGIPWFAVDPKGDWYGIRSSADGKGPGLPIPVFGGLHGDVPLEAGAAAYIADLLVDQMLSAVLDVSRFSAADLAKFLVAFCHRIFARHQADPHVRTAIFEEAHRYIPQQVTSATAALKEACAKIPLEGRAFGLGSLAPSQRSSRLHKDVLTQFSVMIAMRSPAKLDRDAIGGWVEEHGVAKEMLASLPELDSGEGWLWSPHYLHRADRVRFRRRETFDSGATPKVGQTIRVPRTIADVDLAAIKEAMAETIERAKADDPTELRRRIRDLERRLKDRPAAEPERIEIPVEVQVPVVAEDLVARLETASTRVFDVGAQFEVQADAIRSELNAIVAAVGGRTHAEETVAKERARPAREAGDGTSNEQARSVARVDGDTKLGKGERTVLDVLAEYPDGRTYNELAFLAGYSAKASTLGVILSNLRKAALVEPGNNPVRPTAEGLAVVGGARERPTGSMLLDQWLRHPRMGEGERRVLLALIDLYPDAPSNKELCEVSGYSPTASTMGVILSKLRKLGLVDKGARRVAREFMDAIT